MQGNTIISAISIVGLVLLGALALLSDKNSEVDLVNIVGAIGIVFFAVIIAINSKSFVFGWHRKEKEESVNISVQNPEQNKK